jgi:hypothetical protein
MKNQEPDSSVRAAKRLGGSFRSLFCFLVDCGVRRRVVAEMRATTAMKVHTLDDYTVLSIHCSQCNTSIPSSSSAHTLYLLHRDHLEQVTVSLLTPSRGPAQSIVRIQLLPRSTPSTGARLIQPSGRETTVYPIHPTSGFSHQEIVRLVGEPYETFLLPGGSLLVIQSLSAGAHASLRNKTATELLRLARDRPRDAVHGDALLLHADEI